MTRAIAKKATVPPAPTPPLPTSSDSAILPATEPTEEPEPDTEEPDSIEIIFDAAAGTAAVELTNGYTFTFKEPRAKAFLHLSSRLNSAPAYMQTDIMGGFFLAYHMIVRITKPTRDGSGVPLKVEIPSYEEWEDWLGDDDIRRIGAVLTRFPTVGARMAKLFGRTK